MIIYSLPRNLFYIYKSVFVFFVMKGENIISHYFCISLQREKRSGLTYWNWQAKLSRVSHSISTYPSSRNAFTCAPTCMIKILSYIQPKLNLLAVNHFPFGSSYAAGSLSSPVLSSRLRVRNFSSGSCLILYCKSEWKHTDAL